MDHTVRRLATSSLKAKIHGVLIAAPLCVVAGLVFPLPAVSGVSREADRNSEPTHPFIVVLKDAKVANPARVAERHEENRDADLAQVYDTAIEGYAAELTRADKKAIEQDPNVAYVERDLPVELLSQTIPTGVSRVGMTSNSSLNPAGNVDVQIDADVAVIDTPIDFRHPDLNVVASVNCNENDKPPYVCKNSNIITGFHGTHVAGIIGAEDNGFGVVGTAPGVRLWSASIGSGTGVMSGVVAGLDWAVGTGKIEVVNMSLACGDSSGQPWCQSASSALKTAIANAIDAGIVVVVAAGNEHQDVAMVPRIPASFPDPITVSALADFDGAPGALAPVPTAKACNSDGATKPEEKDDSLAEFSNWGAGVDIIAPGSCILSTMPLGTAPGGGDYQKLSGTSMATPHVAGAAAVLAAVRNPSNRSDVMAIRQDLLNEGNFNWTDDSGWGSYSPDTVQEPLLDIGDSSVFKAPHPGSVGSVGVVSHTAGSMDLFARNATDEIWHKVYHPAPLQWGQWYTEPLPNGKPIFGAPAVGSREPLSRDLFARDHDGYLYFRNFYSGQGWSPWFWIPGPHDGKILNSPAVTDRPDRDNGLDVVVRSDNNRIYFKEYTDPTGWSGWQGLGEPPPGTASSPATAVHLGQYWHIVVRGADGNIWDRAWGEGLGWTEWISLGAPSGGATSAPALTVTESDNDLYLFVRGADEAIHMRKGAPGGWGAWQSLGGKWVSDPAATSMDSAGVSVFAVGLDNKIQERRYLYGGWTNWMRIDDNDCPPPECTWAPSKEGAVFKSSPDPTDLITVDSSGTANVYTSYDGGFLLSDPVESQQGQLDPALLDGKGHYVVDVADVDDDLHSDLITVKDDGKVQVHLGQADRTFGAAADTGISLPPVMNGAGENEPIAVADVDGDGFDDLIVFTGPSPGSIKVYRGQQNGKFAAGAVAQSTVWSGLKASGGEYFVDAGDVTGDGRADLVSMNTWDDLYVRAGKSDGTFAAAVSSHWGQADTSLDDGTGEEPIGLGDLNGDGKADLLTLDGSIPKLRPGTATGAFAAVYTPYGGAIDSSLLDGTGENLLGLLDYNGDSRADLVSLTADGQLRTYPAAPDGTLTSPVVAEPGGAIPSIRHRAVGDEIAIQKPLLRRAGCAESGCELPVAPSPSSDVDGDGRADLVALSPDGVVYTYKGDDGYRFDGGAPSESFRIEGVGALDPAQFDGLGAYIVDVADVTGDRRDDLIGITSGGEAAVAPGLQSGSFSHAVTTSLSGLTPALLVPGGYEPIAAADVTRDNRADLIAYNDETDRVIVYPGNASGAFSAGVITPTQIWSALHTGTVGDGEYFVDAADVTGDGRADLVSMNTWDDLYVRAGKSDGTFAAAVSSHWGAANTAMDDGVGLEPLGLGDVTGDRKADLVLRSATGVVVVYPGQSNARFGTAINSLSLPSSTFGDVNGYEVVGVLDVNGDGYADLVAVGPAGTVHVTPGKADGFFGTGYASFGGAFKSTQHFKNQNADGRELVFEKPAVRRRGCEAGGC